MPTLDETPGKNISNKMREEPSSSNDACPGKRRYSGTVVLAIIWLLPVGVVLEANMVDPNRAVLWPYILNNKRFAGLCPCAPPADTPVAALDGGGPPSAPPPAPAATPAPCACACPSAEPAPAPLPCICPTAPPAPAPAPEEAMPDLCQRGAPSADAVASREDLATSRRPLSEGMLAFRKELEKSLPKRLLLNLIDPKSQRGTCRSFGMTDKFNPRLSYDYGLGYKLSWTAEEIGACIRRLPNRKVLLLGDSRMRNNWFTVKGILFDHRRAEEVWHESHVGDRSTHVLTLPNGDGTVVFRFLQSAGEGTRGLQEHLDADVVVFMSALWDLQKSSNTAGFMLRYVQGLARTILYAQKNFVGRMLFWGSAPVNDHMLNPTGDRYKYLFDSKIEAYNLFAQKLARAAGFEWFSPWTFLFTGAAKLGFDVEELYQDDLHPNGKTQMLEATLLLNEICYADGFTEQTAQAFVDLTEDDVFKDSSFPLITNCSTKAGSVGGRMLSRRRRKT